jgi:hypothetical protein
MSSGAFSEAGNNACLPVGYFSAHHLVPAPDMKPPPNPLKVGGPAPWSTASRVKRVYEMVDDHLSRILIVALCPSFELR